MPLRLLTSKAHLRRIDHKQMHVIPFAVELFQLGLEGGFRHNRRRPNPVGFWL
jgi:hypothetical protein